MPPASRGLAPPVLLLDAKDGLSVRAADIQVRLQGAALRILPPRRLSAEVESAGRAAVAAHTFVELITLLDDHDLTLDDHDGRLRVQGFQVDSAFQVLDPDSVPAEFTVARGQLATVSTTDLFTACGRVEIAIASDDTVPILTGALAQLRSQELVLVGTDGRRLALDKIKVQATPETSIQVVLPAKLVGEIRRLFEFEGGQILCVVDPSGRRVAFETANVSVRALALEGAYPNYATRLPKRVLTTCIARTEMLIRRLQAAAMFAPVELHSIELQMTPGTGLAFSASAPDRGGTLAQLPSEVSGRASRVAVNPAFLLDGLKVVASEQVELQVSDEPEVLLLKAAPPDSFLYVVVPFVRRSD